MPRPDETSRQQPNSITPTPTQSAYRDVKSFLEARVSLLGKEATRYVTPERLVSVALSAFSRQPDLLECTRESLFRCCQVASQCGLEIGGQLGHAYFVPFRNQHLGGRKEAIPIIGYRGLAYMAVRCGAAKHVHAKEVYWGDTFEFADGLEPVLKHTPCSDEDRDRTHGVNGLRGAYCVVTLPDGTKIADYMPAADIERRRAISKGKDSLMWTTFPEEGYRKTVVRRVLKELPITTVAMVRELEMAAQHDGSSLEELADVEVEIVESRIPDGSEIGPPRTLDDLERGKTTEPEPPPTPPAREPERCPDCQEIGHHSEMCPHFVPPEPDDPPPPPPPPQTDFTTRPPPKRGAGK